MSYPESDDRYPETVSREALLRAYIEDQVTYLMREQAWLKKEDGNNLYKNEQINNEIENRIREIVTERVKSQLKRPKARVIGHKVPGEAEDMNMDLLSFTKKSFTKIITPSGSIYKTAKEKVSFLKDKITLDKSNRSDHKKKMFVCKVNGDKDGYNYWNNSQSLDKIGMNSYPGAMACKYSFLTDKAGFNSTTSSSRYLIMNAYAHTERMLEGNFYFLTKEHVKNHITICCRSCPNKKVIMNIVNKYSLFIPSWDDVYEFLNSNYKQYQPDKLDTTISQLLMLLPVHELVYLYYFGNLKHILQSNTHNFKQWIHDFYNEELALNTVDLSTINPEDLYKLDGTLVTLISTVYNEQLPLVGDKKVNIYDTITQYPDIAKKFLVIGNYMQNKLDTQFNDMFSLFLDTHCVIPNTIDHKHMFRKCVILSDTDSVVFTTKNWLIWYKNDYLISQEAYQINSLVVYWLTKSIEFLLRTMSIARGALGKDTEILAMKNEFYYPSMIQSSLKKHYAGLVLVREGSVFPKPDSDIKGINFRGSKLADETKSFVKEFIDETNRMIIYKGKISAKERIWKIAQFERLVFDSINKGELKFLNVIPVKNADEYKNSESSIYFNYQFWEHVFASKYGSIQIPTKCYSLPTVNIYNPEYFKFLEKSDKELYGRLLEFKDQYSKKKITRLPINPVLDTIPVELQPVIYKRQVVYDNSIPLSLFMESFGITLGNSAKSRALCSEIYQCLY